MGRGGVLASTSEGAAENASSPHYHELRTCDAHRASSCPRRGARRRTTSFLRRSSPAARTELRHPVARWPGYRQASSPRTEISRPRKRRNPRGGRPTDQEQHANRIAQIGRRASLDADRTREMIRITRRLREVDVTRPLHGGPFAVAELKKLVEDNDVNSNSNDKPRPTRSKYLGALEWKLGLGVAAEFRSGCSSIKGRAAGATLLACDRPHNSTRGFQRRDVESAAAYFSSWDIGETFASKPTLATGSKI